MALVSIMDTIIKLRISKHDFKHLCIGWCNLKKIKRKEEKDMKMYLVGVNHAAGQVKLVRYETKDSWNNQNPNGLRYVSMLGCYFNLEMEDSVKRNCLRYIKKNYPDFYLMDYSAEVIRQNR